jgi:hypothetical protein
VVPGAAAPVAGWRRPTRRREEIETPGFRLVDTKFTDSHEAYEKKKRVVRNKEKKGKRLETVNEENKVVNVKMTASIDDGNKGTTDRAEEEVLGLERAGSKLEGTEVGLLDSFTASLGLLPVGREKRVAVESKEQKSCIMEQESTSQSSQFASGPDTVAKVIDEVVKASREMAEGSEEAIASDETVLEVDVDNIIEEVVQEGRKRKAVNPFEQGDDRAGKRQRRSSLSRARLPPQPAASLSAHCASLSAVGASGAERLACEHCAFTASGTRGMSIHLARCHVGRGAFLCPHCGFRAPLQGRLDRWGHGSVNWSGGHLNFDCAQPRF